MNIRRIDQSPLPEICNPAPLGDSVYFLYQRLTQPLPYRKVNVNTEEVSEAYLPPYPLTTWFWAKHLNRVVFVGQAYTEGWLPPDNPNRVACGGVEPSSISCSVVNENGAFSFHPILRTDNVNELIGACYHDGKFIAGERSGYLPHEDPDYYKKCAEHKEGGGIWLSSGGKTWSWSGFRDPLADTLGFGRQVNLGVLNGVLYACLQGWGIVPATPTGIYIVHNDYSATHMADTPENAIGLVPYPFNNNQFSWKDAMIMWNSYPALAVFNPSLTPSLQFWDISVDGVPVDNAGAAPVGVHDGKLLIATVINGNYTICQASELFGSVTRIADNWLPGTFSPKGFVHDNKLWIALAIPGGTALDVLQLDDVPPVQHKLTFVVKYKGEPIKDAEVEVFYG